MIQNVNVVNKDREKREEKKEVTTDGHSDVHGINQMFLYNPSLIDAVTVAKWHPFNSALHLL